jgi:MFS family permease
LKVVTKDESLRRARRHARFGTRRAMWGGLAIAGLGLPLVVSGRLGLVLIGLGLVAIGTFLAQAVATGFVGRAARSDRGAASGLYLASYFLGGLVGSFVLGQLFDRFGWAACVAGIGVALGMAALLAFRLTVGRAMEDHPRHTGQEHEQAQVA